MSGNSLKICVLRIEGSGGAWDSYQAFQSLGAETEMVHLNQLEGRSPARMQRSLEDYDALVLPSGFSAGDYVRPGAILAARIRDSLSKELDEFVADGKAVLGTGNGFQVLMELGLLPGNGADLALAANESARFESRSAVLRHVGKGRCRLSADLREGQMLTLPIAHSHGRLVSLDAKAADKLEKDDQIVLRYSGPRGEDAEYPWNPDGSIGGIAGICNPNGNVLGMMPLPERALSPYTVQGWNRGPVSGEGDGAPLLRSLLKNIRP